MYLFSHRVKVYFLVKLSHGKILREFKSKYYYINELFHGNKIYILRLLYLSILMIFFFFLEKQHCLVYFIESRPNQPKK